MMLARYYGNCLIVPEVNKGVGLTDKLKELGCNLYQQEEFNLISQKWTRKVGWNTQADNRHLPIDALGDAVRDGRVDIGCPNVVSEMQTFVRNKRGKDEAASGRHDDDVMMAGIGLYCLSQATFYREEVRKRSKPADWDQWERL